MAIGFGSPGPEPGAAALPFVPLFVLPLLPMISSVTSAKNPAENKKGRSFGAARNPLSFATCLDRRSASAARGCAHTDAAHTGAGLRAGEAGPACLGANQSMPIDPAQPTCISARLSST